MTPSEVETAARNRYNSVSDNFYSQAEIFQLINEAENVLAMEFNGIETTDTSITTVADTQTYAFPTDVFAIRRITYDGNKLQNITMREDDRLTLQNATTTATGTPQYYWVWDEIIYLRPIPAAAAELKLWVYKEPTTLTTTPTVSTTLSVPSQFHFILIDYVAMQMAMKDDNTSAASKYELRWERGVNKAREWIKRRKRSDRFQIVKDSETLAETIIGDV